MKIESKEKLAKLLAVEDLDVQHQQVETAYFDIKNRCLILPIWKEMPDHLYDLLVGHEVGHALFTPTNLERVQKAYKKSSKSCVNIIEDARIEKLVKNRYPGLRKQFFSGYKHLVEKDFFGISKRPISEMNILDKINLYFKIPTSVDISFNDIEEGFVQRIENARSFKDVEKISEEVYAYAKEQKEEMEEVEGNSEEVSTVESDEKFDGEEVETSEAEAGDEDQEENEDGDNVESDEKEKAEGEGDESPVDEEQQAFDNYMNQGDNKPLPEDEEPEPLPDEGDKKPEDEVRATTMDHFQERLNELIEKETTNIYYNVPNAVDLNVGLVDYKVVHKNIDDFYGSIENNPDTWGSYYTEGQFDALKKFVYEEGHKTLNKIKKDSVKTVNHIAMEFERKKAADVYKKTSVAKTGVLDTNKLFSAKYNDDVFKRNITIPEGKSHGLVMIIDWSGSMAGNIFGCIKQVIELTLFCKKVNIPFEVYSFMERDDREGCGKDYKKTPRTFKYRHRDFVTDSRVCLRNYLSHRMTVKDFNKGLLNLCILANRNNSKILQHRSYYPVPKDDELKCTPLNGAILLSEHVIRKFKKDNHLECVHAVWLTDGESSGSGHWWDATKPEGQQIVRDGMYKEKCNIYLKDTKMKKNYLLAKGGYYGRGSGTTPACLDIVKDRLGINQIGFFIVDRFSNSSLWRFVPRRNTPNFAENERFYKEWVTKAKRDGWFVKTEAGYDEYYVIRGDNLHKEIADLDVSPEMTARKMATNFMRKNNAFKTNRVILSRFIDLITAKTTA
jgi:hypothetical protein